MNEGSFPCVFFVVAGLLTVGVVQHFVRQQREAQILKAKVAYGNALAGLKAKPTDAGCRQAALEAGRSYSNLTRESRGVTIFDEMALKNDLDAASAGAAAMGAQPVAEAASVADRLRKLDDLRWQGLLSEDEYQASRARILAEL